MRSLRNVISVLLAPLVLVWSKLWDFMPVRCKRMCVLVSLYARMENFDEDDIQHLKQINERLHLTRDVNALRFPTLLAPWLWGNVITADKVDPDRTEQYIDRLARRTPCWLQYTDTTSFKEDLRQILELCNAQAVR